MAMHLKGNILGHYDNFSHWGLVVRIMLQENRLPSFVDSFLKHQSYPMGTSIFIYYFCRLVSPAESMMMFAQQIMQLSCLFSLCALIRRKNVLYSIIAVAAYSVYATVANVSLYDLLVDTVLPVAAVSAFLLIIIYHNQPQKLSVCLSIMLAWIVSIKNSGLFFYAVSILMLIRISCKNRYNPKMLSVPVIFPPVMVYLWKRHISYAFSSGLTTAHSMSLSNFKATYAQKSAQSIADIFSQYFEKMMSYENYTFPYLRVIVLATVVFAIFLLCCVAAKKEKEYIVQGIRNWFLIVGFFVAYHIGMSAMYVFSMPAGEAAYLAGFDRYHYTIEIFCYGALLCVSLLSFEEFSNCVLAKVGVLAVLLIPLMINVKAIKPAFGGNRPSNARLNSHYKLIDIKKNAGMAEKQSYLLFKKGEADTFTSYMMKYEFLSANVRVVNSIEDFDKYKNKYTYWIIWDGFDLISELECFSSVDGVRVDDAHVFYH